MKKKHISTYVCLYLRYVKPLFISTGVSAVASHVSALICGLGAECSAVVVLLLELGLQH